MPQKYARRFVDFMQNEVFKSFDDLEMETIDDLSNLCAGVGN